ncbi:MAG: cytochrome c [Gemmatimonadaceae bacterium]|jgi:mono/diheme cytochrome c family protein|nr:cytochrome c [Gemmatimonadaceae bacterium]
MTRLKQRPHLREFDDPEERDRPLPRLLLFLVPFMMLWGGYYIATMDTTADPTLGDGRTRTALMPAVGGGAANGAQLFTTKCAACHQSAGQGVAGVFPPLAASEWVTGSERVLVQILLHGIQGEITVKGVRYNGLMPPWKSLTDEEIAAIATHIRSQWGNGASPVTAATVAAEREATASRSAPWKGESELSALK